MGKHPLVSVFLDGLRADWVEQMPFVRSVSAPREMRTEFGYSIACHASMYTGASIQEHGYWFVWRRDEQASAFPAWLAKVPRPLDNVGSRLALRKALVSRLPEERRPRGYFGVPRLVHTPVRHWPGLWVSEAKFWTDPGYAPMPTVFDLARRRGVPYDVVGLHHGGEHLPDVEAPLRRVGDREWYYLFLGEVDHAAHTTGGDGPHFTNVLEQVDRAIEARCREVERAHGGYDLLLWSDHGHRRVERYVDVYERVPAEVMRGVPHIVDTNFARFWTRTEAERSRLSGLLAAVLPEGRVLDEAEQREAECFFPDHRYGDVVFYLDAPCAFARTAWGYSRSQRSVHGYDPSLPEMNATLVTNLDVAPTRLREIFGVHVDRLGLRQAVPRE